MKKLLAISLSVAVLAVPTLSLTGCGNNDDNGKAESKSAGEIGTFYSVTQAYGNGDLTLEDVKSIAYYYNGGTKYNEEIMGEDYTPLPKNPEELSAETKKSIINTFYNSSYWEQYENYFSKEDIGCSFYGGTYGDAIVVMVLVDGQAVSDVVWEEKIDGVTIYYTCGVRLSVWVGNNQ
ncbi:MAG: hypothetical protein NC184_07680 [Roseburia sp.]|nr:hypothetical protein [Roseburia sp.]